MSPRAVIVTGLCRAGSAAFAEVLHCLGFPMGRSFAAPIAPDYRLDWEDHDLTNQMAASVEAGAQPMDVVLVDRMVEARLAHSLAFGFGGRVGFKSPLFSIGLAIDDLEGAILDALGAPATTSDDVVLVRVERAQAAIDRSIARQPGAATLRRWNAWIAEEEPTKPDVVLHYEALVANPGGEVARLAKRLGVLDPGVIQRAAARVVRPCS